MSNNPFFEKDFFPEKLHKKLVDGAWDDPYEPWNQLNDNGEAPGDICCQRAAEMRCHEHNPINYLQYWSGRERNKEKMIEHALQIAVRYGGIDGAHHKDWVIDQIVRALTNCPIEEKVSEDCRGESYSFETQGESEAYKELVEWSCDGEDGPNTYSWDKGIAP